MKSAATAPAGGSGVSASSANQRPAAVSIMKLGPDPKLTNEGRRVRHGGALYSRRLRAASQTTSGYIAISTAEWPGPSSGRPGLPLSTAARACSQVAGASCCRRCRWPGIQVPPRRAWGDGPLVDALLGAGLTVVVITSRQVKNLRSRFGAAGAKDDRFDAFVLADTLRTDRARLRPLVPDAPAAVSLRMAVRARRDLVRHRVAACDQLRAHLAVAFPAGITLFHDLDSPISLAFLARFGSQDAAAGLDEQAIGGWLATAPP